MRAWKVRKAGEPHEVLELVECPVPEPGRGQLRVRVGAAALGLPDVFMCRGVYPLTPPLPFTPGQELAGIVTAAGEGTEARVGDRVMGVSVFLEGHGGFAEEALLTDDFSFPVPEEMSDEEAASFVIPYHTAWVGLVQRGGLRPGETLLVLGGSGGTGCAAIQLGRALGARVLATASGPERAAFCRDLGAEWVVDPRGSFAEAVRERTGGRGADVIYDPVGGDAFESATRCIAHEGRLLTVGFASGRWADPSTAHLTVRNYSVVGVFPGGYDRAFRLRAHRELLAHYRAGRIRAPLTRVVPLDSLPDALVELGARRSLGRVVVRT